MNDDEVLLDQLADALAPEPCVPPAEGVQALHRSIDAAALGARPQRRRPRRRWLLPAVATVAALGVGNLALAAAGTSLPRVVRAAAHAVKLPVDSPALLDTRQHRDALRAALDRDDKAAIETEARQLRAAFLRLDNGERNTIAVDVEQLLARADSTRAAVNDDATSPTSPPSSTPAVTSTPAGQSRTDDTAATTDSQEPDAKTGDETTDTSGTHVTTSTSGQDNGNNQGVDNGPNVDNNQPDSGQQNAPTNEGGKNTSTSSDGSGSG